MEIDTTSLPPLRKKQMTTYTMSMNLSMPSTALLHGIGESRGFVPPLMKKDFHLTIAYQMPTNFLLPIKTEFFEVGVLHLDVYQSRTEAWMGYPVIVTESHPKFLALHEIARATGWEHDYPIWSPHISLTKLLPIGIAEWVKLQFEKQAFPPLELVGPVISETRVKLS
jgi:hypothetical protein